MFQGNTLFASERQMSCKKTSRKDDLISLFYLLIFMLNNSLWIGSEDPTFGKRGKKDIYKSIFAWKRKHDLCWIADRFRARFEFPLKNVDKDQESHIKNFHLNICLIANEI